MYTIKEFLDEFEELGKGERVDAFLDVVMDLSDWYVKKSYRKDALPVVKDLFAIMCTKAFTKTLKKASKVDAYACVEFCTVIGDFLENSKNLPEEYQPTDEIREIYVTILQKLLTGRAKDLSKKVYLPADLIINLLVVMPTQNCFSSNKFIGIQVNRVNKKIYSTVATMEEVDNPEYSFTKKQFKKLYRELFGKSALLDVCLSILLEGKDTIKKFNDRQLKVYNAITEFALDTISQCDKAVVCDIVSEYVSRRSADAKRERDFARRVRLSEVDPEEYRRIAKAVKTIKEQVPEVAKFL